jgi:hypothetical protein
MPLHQKKNSLGDKTMTKTKIIGRWWGVEWGYWPLAGWLSLLLWAGLAGWLWGRVGDWPTAVGGGLLCLLLHWLGEMAHQAGHAFMAKRVGYPQSRWVFLHLLLAAQYPKSEPPLPTAVHRQRAIGGVPVSMSITAVAAVWLFAFTPASPLWLAIAQFLFWENLLLYTCGALFPIHTLTGKAFETDGDALIRLWRQVQ